jgi:heptosyltransferase-2
VVRGVNWLGDAVMTTPALRRLREARPEATLVLLTPSKLADLWRGFTEIDACLSVAPDETVWQVGRRLKAERFDIAMILPNSVRSALETWLGGIPRRIGYAAPWRNRLLTEAVRRPAGVVAMRKRPVRQIRALVAGSPMLKETDSPALTPESHHLHHYLRLAACLGANPDPVPPRLDLGAEESTAVCERFGLSPAGAQPVLGLNPGAEYGPAKRWPRDRFVAVAREVHRRNRCRCLIFGGPGDRELAAVLTAELSAALVAGGSSPAMVQNLAGATTLRELCILIKACRAFLTNDTGPMHLAAAVGTPVIVPFGSTSPALTGPGLPADPRHQLMTAPVPCSPCFRRECPIDFRCMHAITPEAVTDAVLRVM